MLFSLCRWRPRHLLMSWCAYWGALALIKLWEPARIAWRLTQLPDEHGQIDAGFNNSLLHLTMKQDGAVVWTGSIELAMLVLLTCGPPLVLFVLWLLRRPARADAARRGGALPDGAPEALGAGPMADVETARRTEERVGQVRNRAR